MINWKQLLLLNGNKGLDMSMIKHKFTDILDFRAINCIFLQTKKRPFCFINNTVGHTRTAKISCRWEFSRQQHLRNSILNNPRLGEICCQILQKIFFSGCNGIYQHIIGTELGLQARDIHHRIDRLIKMGLVVKKKFTIKFRSKLNNAIQLKCIIFENSNKKDNFYKNSFNLKDFELIKRSIQIVSRIDREIRQKDIKYGILNCKNFLYAEKRCLHRNWQKIKQKFLKANINITKINNYISFDKRIVFFGGTEIVQKEGNSPVIYDYRYFTNNIHPIILFLFSPEIQIKKALRFNRELGISSPFMLEKFRGYVNYKIIQTILKSMEEKGYLFKNLEQKGRQRIINYRLDIRILTEYEKKLKYGVTSQVANRRLILLSWVETQILLVKDLGRKIAQKEKKGLRKVDSKVVRRVLRDLIEKGFLKIFKINIQILNANSKAIEIITKKDFDNTNFNFIFYFERLQKNLKKYIKKKEELIRQKINLSSPIILSIMVPVNNFKNLSLLMKNIEFIPYFYLKFENTFELVISNFLDLEIYDTLASFCSRYFHITKSIVLRTKKNFLFKNFSIHNGIGNFLKKNYLPLKIFKFIRNPCYLRKIESKSNLYNNTEKTEKFMSFLFKLKFDKLSFHIPKNSFKYPQNNGNKVQQLDFKTLTLNFTGSLNFIKNLRYKKKPLKLLKFIRVGNDADSTILLEKWDSELDVKLLERYLIEKVTQLNNNVKYQKKRTFIRRLNRILIVANVRLAISFFYEFSKFKFSDFLIMITFTPKNILKRALEFSKFNFNFSLNKIICTKNLGKTISIGRFNSIEKNCDKLFKDLFENNCRNNYFFLKSSKDKILFNRLFWKFSWLIFTTYNLKSYLDFNILKKIIKLREKYKKNDWLKKITGIRLLRKNQKNFFPSSFQILDLFKKINLLILFFKIERDSFGITPFFLNKISNDYIRSENEIETNFKKNNYLSFNHQGKIAKPMEIRIKRVISSFATIFKLTDNSINHFKCFFPIKKTMISFFVKLNYVKQNAYQILPLTYTLPEFLTEKKSEIESSRKKKWFSREMFFEFLPWTDLINYFIEKSAKIFNLVLFLKITGKLLNNQVRFKKSNFLNKNWFLFFKNLNWFFLSDFFLNLKSKKCFFIIDKTLNESLIELPFGRKKFFFLKSKGSILKIYLKKNLFYYH